MFNSGKAAYFSFQGKQIFHTTYDVKKSSFRSLKFGFPTLYIVYMGNTSKPHFSYFEKQLVFNEGSFPENS